MLLPPPAWILSLLPTGLLAYDEEDEPWHERLYLARLGSSAWRVVLTPDDDMFLELCSDENEDVTAVRYTNPAGTFLSVWAQPMASRSTAFGVGLGKLILLLFSWKFSASPTRPQRYLRNGRWGRLLLYDLVRLLLCIRRLRGRSGLLERLRVPTALNAAFASP